MSDYETPFKKWQNQPTETSGFNIPPKIGNKKKKRKVKIYKF